MNKIEHMSIEMASMFLRNTDLTLRTDYPESYDRMGRLKYSNDLQISNDGGLQYHYDNLLPAKCREFP